MWTTTVAAVVHDEKQYDLPSLTDALRCAGQGNRGWRGPGSNIQHTSTACQHCCQVLGTERQTGDTGSLPPQNSVSYKKQLSKGLKCCFLHVTVRPALSAAGLHTSALNPGWKSQETASGSNNPEGRAGGEERGAEKAAAGQEVSPEMTRWELRAPVELHTEPKGPEGQEKELNVTQGQQATAHRSSCAGTSTIRSALWRECDRPERKGWRAGGPLQQQSVN